MWLTIAVVYLAIAVFGYFIRGRFVWTFGAYTLFFAASGVMHYFAARRARVELHETGVRRVEGMLGAGRFFKWEEIDHLSVDPPGGPRIPRLNLRNGEQLALPVKEKDLPTLTECVRARLEKPRTEEG